MELFHSNLGTNLTSKTILRNYSITFNMPKGYKTLSIKDEAWDYAKALFKKQSNRNISFSSWVSEFLQFSVQRDLFFEYMRTGLVVMENENHEPVDPFQEQKDEDEVDLMATLTVVDKIKKEFIDVTLDPQSDGIENEGGYYCDKCKSRRCQHALFVASSPEGIKEAVTLPSAFQRYLQDFLKENKKE